MSTVTLGLPPLPPKWTGKFRKRPVVVEAVQLVDDDACDWDEIARWCGGRIYNIETSPGAEPQTLIDIPTLEGTMTAGEGWWVVRGVVGEFYPVRADIFKATYEPAGSATGGKAVYETWRAAVPDVVCNVPGGPWEDLPATVQAGFDAIAARQPQPAPGLDAAYLYHWRFDRGEEFGLYWHAADADAKAAERAGEGLCEVLSMAIVGDRPGPQPVPGTALRPGVVYVCPGCGAEDDDEAVIARCVARHPQAGPQPAPGCPDPSQHVVIRDFLTGRELPHAETDGQQPAPGDDGDYELDSADIPSGWREDAEQPAPGLAAAMADYAELEAEAARLRRLLEDQGRGDEAREFLTPAEAALRLRVHPRTLSRLVAAGKLTPDKTPGGHRRYRAAEIEVARLERAGKEAR